MMDLISDEKLFITMTLSLKVAGYATFFSSLVGIILGYFLSVNKNWFGRIVDVVLTLPMVMPPTVLGYYLLVLMGRNGIIGQWLNQYFGIHLIFTWQGAVLAASVVIFPLILKPAKAAFENIDPHLGLVAQTLGLSKKAVFFRITLPLAWKGILSGILLAFARSLGEFGATLMIAGNIPGKTQTLSIAIYEATQAGQDELAHILVVLISLICIIILLLANTLAYGMKNDR